MNVMDTELTFVDVAELRRWIDDPRDPLVPRCFVQTELDEIGDGADRIDRLAGRFAAKEAVLKALGTGFGAGVAFTDVLFLRAPALRFQQKRRVHRRHKGAWPGRGGRGNQNWAKKRAGIP